MKVQKVKKMITDNEIQLKNIIDVREKYEVKSGKINGSTNITMNTLLSKPDKYLKKDEHYYIICQSGARSFAVTLNLKLKGYKVTNISGGYLKWKEKNM